MVDSPFSCRAKPIREPDNSAIQSDADRGNCPWPPHLKKLRVSLPTPAKSISISITPQSHTIDDLGIDSLDFLDIVFAIDKEFGIKVPLEKWTQEVNDGKVSTEEYFVMENLCAKIDALVAAKNAV